MAGTTATITVLMTELAEAGQVDARLDRRP